MVRKRPPSLAELQASLRKFFESRAVRKAIVFGSYARGTQTRRSDLDIALIMDTDKRFLDRYQGILGLREAAGGVPVEALVYAPGEIEAISDRPFVRRLLREGVVIYER